MNIARRNFIKYSALITGSALLGTAGYHTIGSINTTEKIDVKIDDIYIPNLPEQFIDFKIGFLSDIHLGPYLRESFLISALDKIVAHTPDILVIGGDHLHLPTSVMSKIFGFPRNQDFADDSDGLLAQRIIQRLVEILSNFNFKHGIIAIPGNHDNSNAYRFAKSIFEKNNMRYLVNESEIVSKGRAKLEFVGVDDYWTGVPRLPRSQNSKSSKRILCAHNPDFAGLAVNNNAGDYALALTGHTHAGQICTQSGRPLICNVYDRSLVKGIKLVRDTPILVSAGIGTVEIPYRFNCSAEVHVLTLKAQSGRITG